MIKNILIIAFILIFSTLESSVLPVLIVPLIVISISIISHAKSDQLLIFFIGLIYDLILVNPLGLSSIIFLLSYLLINIYRKKFQQKNYLYVFIFTFIILFSFNYLENLQKTSLQIFLNTLLIFIILPIIYLLDNYLTKKNSYKINL